jgi:uncharacterized membrane protein YsdA (DUF1294 family)
LNVASINPSFYFQCSINDRTSTRLENLFAMATIIVYLLLTLFMSMLTFLIWGWDKSAAMHERGRIPERTLLMMILLGGAAGGALGMSFFHHKTRKPLFRPVLWAAGVLQLMFLLLLVYLKG